MDDGATVNLDATLASLDIRGLTADSRRVQPGYVFAALPGARHDGATFVGEALKRGAVAVIASTEAARVWPGTPILVHDNPRRALARMAARFHGRQPRFVAAVTGTNGKTSTVVFARQIWTRLGRKAASLGTLGIHAPSWTTEQGLTTADPVALHEALARLADAGVDRAAMEASSHGLAQFRLDGVRVAIAAFTNLTRDHLDYHGSMAAYRDAKARLFAELVQADGTAVVNADGEEGAHFIALARTRGLRLIDYGAAASALRLLAREARPDGQSLSLSWQGARRDVFLPLVAAFQASNAMGAAAIAIASGEDPDAVFDAMGRLDGVPGRVERAAVLENGAAVYVDYAHTPDALQTVLAALRPHARGRLLVAFGCGGDRDAGKRPLMGAVAQRLADLVVVTDDNPRSEDPAAIRRQVRAGCPDAREIGSRAEAIDWAVCQLAPGDVLVLAGKGHERTQTIGDKVLPFDDAAVAREAVARRGGRA